VALSLLTKLNTAGASGWWGELAVLASACVGWAAVPPSAGDSAAAAPSAAEDFSRSRLVSWLIDSSFRA